MCSFLIALIHGGFLKVSALTDAVCLEHCAHSTGSRAKRGPTGAVGQCLLGLRSLPTPIADGRVTVPAGTRLPQLGRVTTDAITAAAIVAHLLVSLLPLHSAAPTQMAHHVWPFKMMLTDTEARKRREKRGGAVLSSETDKHEPCAHMSF